MRYRIKNWREYQHYKGRCPPWIKFHSHTLTSKDWTMLNDAGKLAMVVCMVMASMDKAGDGSFDGDPSYIMRVAYLDAPPDLRKLVDSGFLVVASECKQMLANASPSVSVSPLLSVSASEGGLGETTAKVSDFAGMPPEGSVRPAVAGAESFDSVHDFDEDVACKARECYTAYHFRRHGSLQSISSEPARRDLRSMAIAIDAFPDGYEKLKAYTSLKRKDLPDGHTVETKVFMILKHLHLDKGDLILSSSSSSIKTNNEDERLMEIVKKGKKS